MKVKLLVSTIIFAGIAVLFGILFKEQSQSLLQFFTQHVSQYKVQFGNKKNSNIFSKDLLKQYDGIINKKLYLSILGNVYDVTKGEKHYGPGQAYHMFTGKDASKSFITGEFDEKNLSDDVSDLKPEELLSLEQWKNFYDKEYITKGVLIGKYYDEEGKATKYFDNIQELMKNAEKSKNEKQVDEQVYPPCNIEWNAEHGTRVWCTKQSGGVSRNWIGVPRKYYSTGSISYRCACVQDVNNPKLHEYENCDSLLESCYINE